MKAVFLEGTLKRMSSSEYSHTETLSRLLSDELAALGMDSEMIRLADRVIPPGTKTDMGAGDEWPEILDKLFAADVIIFATPIWWGSHSSLIQRVFERMDELNDEIIASGKSELGNKIGGIVITGAEDGAEHIIGTLANFMVWNGLTLPPACSLSYLGNFEDTADALLEKFRSSGSTVGMAKTMARNLAHMARVLKDNPIPTAEKGAQAFN